MPTLGVMETLPPHFARQIAEVVEPGDEGVAAEVIEAATHLDDTKLGKFLALLADRVRSSARPITRIELRSFLSASKEDDAAAGS